jgi:primary-amine oxidase
MKRLLLALAFLLVASGVSAQQFCSAPYFVTQSFPTSGPAQTRWKLCWQVLTGPNLVITGAWFQPEVNGPWIKLIYDARISQLFVPYHFGSPRYLDVTYAGTGFGFVPLTTSDCPAALGGTLLGPSSEVCKQVRDRGLMWKHDAFLRRGEELVLWSVLGAANYNYIVEWTFRDDGVVLGRIGATGQIAGPDTHVHGPIWRLDLDLNGACCDTVAAFKHSEVGPTGVDAMPDVATEGGMPWDPVAFTSLHIRDAALKNGLGHAAEWHLMPSREGTPLHQEAFTKNAYWVTKYRWNETFGDNLPSYANGEAVKNADVVLWYYGGLHHMIRDEDIDMTHVMWTGFMLKPHDVWKSTPLFP